MNKLRPVRFKNMSVDMTALCDVAFLLLVFFVVTARFDQWEPMKIITPSVTSRGISGIPNNYLGIIYIAGDKVMYQVVDDELRKATLSEMSNLYHVGFTANKREKFVNSPIIGSPFKDLNAYNNKYMDWTANIDRPGIPYSSVNSELFDWIKQSRLATKAFFSKDLRILIKADKNVKYPVLKQVIDILQAQKVNRFSLLNDTEQTQ